MARGHLEDRREYQHLKYYKQAHEWELMRRYGARAIGIGWKRVDGEEIDQPALIFYVERKVPLDETDTPIPQSLRYAPKGETKSIELATDVVESPEPKFEGDAPRSRDA